MSVDWDAQLLEPLYGEFGKEAVIDADGGPVAVTVIDKTEGVELFTHDLDRPSIAPAVQVRQSELAEKNLDEEGLIDATVTIGGKEWVIINIHARPVDGLGSGELLLLLQDGDL